MKLTKAPTSRKEREEKNEKIKCRYDKTKECDKKSFHFCEDCQKDMNRLLFIR